MGRLSPAPTVRQVVGANGVARLVEADMRFTRADSPGQNTILAVVHVQAETATPGTQDAIRRDLSQAVRERLRTRFNVTPLVDLTVLE
jgi:hypothetical protein